jgi:hypothetical protein
MDTWQAAIAIVAIIVGVGMAGAVAIVGLWAWRERGAGEREEEYQRLAEEASAAQKRTAFELGQIAEDVADMRARMFEMERMLKDVG